MADPFVNIADIEPCPAESVASDSVTQRFDPTLRAVIFDMDGTLVDSERVIMDAWLAATRDLGLTLQPDDYMRVVGLNTAESDEILATLFGDPETLSAVRRSVHERLTSAAAYPLKHGAMELLTTLRELGIPCAVASSSFAHEIEERLTRAGVLHFFAAIAGGDEVDRGKPDPAVYRLAAARLGISPTHCLAFEDSPHGAASASAAGATVVFVPDLREATPDVARSVTLVLGSLGDAVPRIPGWFGLQATP